MNAKDMYGNYTMDVIATCAFATKTNIHKELGQSFCSKCEKNIQFQSCQIDPDDGIAHICDQAIKLAQ